MAASVHKLRRTRPSDAPLSDVALATAASTGDPAAVGALFDRFQPLVTRYLSRAIGPGPDVEDLLQATFLEVARGRARFEGRSSASTWLLGIATNVARHHRRSMGRRRKLESAAKLVREPAESGTAERVDARRRLVLAREALDAMPDERRLAFVLCELEGLSAREAAEALGASEAAVWKRVSQARKEIREHVAAGGRR